MEITFNGSDRSFELLNWRYDAASTVHPCLYKHPSVTLYIYIYIYIYIYQELSYSAYGSTKATVLPRRIDKSKVQMTDPNR